MSVILEIRDLYKSFGGVHAVNDVSMTINKGQVVGLIGPNGAGKTTLMNLICGYYKADKGTVKFNNIDITGKEPNQICRLGISRTFQIPRPFPDMTALANVMVGTMCGKRRPNMSFGDAGLDASYCLQFVGLFSKRNVLARDLTLFELRALEVARVLATSPKLILIDEVMAGLNPGEASHAIKLIKKMMDEYHVTVLWIEHVMKVLMEAADHVEVLHFGEKLICGKPDKVCNDLRVIEAYLGAKIDD